ncbi:uncharacterized protein [Cherax quadricarinatus]|uniref:uncharacterized protein isoform X1 n=1 Tax=Cherax quadricarinatus TaxID=27406 RepID=UPI00387E3118
MALNSVLKVVTIWLVGFTHLTSGHKNDYKGCITENLSEVVKAIRITNNNNNHHQSWVKPLTTHAHLDVAYITPQGTYNIMCTVHFNIPDVRHNFIITLSVDDKTFTNITVLVPELGNNCSKTFTISHQTLYLRSYNNTVQWTNCTTDNTTVNSTLTSSSTSTASSTTTASSTPVSTSTAATPPTVSNTNKVLAACVVLFLIALVGSVYGFFTRYRYQQLLLQKGPTTDPETRDNEYEEWNEKWKMQPVTSGSNEEHSSDISPLKVIQRPGSAHDSENSLYGVI